MKQNETTKILVALSAAIIIIPTTIYFLNKTSYNNTESTNIQNNNTTNQSLFIPPLLKYDMQDGVKNFELKVQEGQHAFTDHNLSKTYGYNGDILGPTIRLQQGDKVNIHVNNTLDEPTTTHWHGGVVPGNADGGVHNIIPPQTSWNAKFDVIQEAATLWYHPHQHQETARQVYNGLAGLLIIDDENSSSLNIPQNYGVDDIPIIIQTKNLNNQGELQPYNISMHDQVMGFSGNTLLINAQIQPTLKVNTNLIRLRILNGSNSDVYTLSFSNNHKFYVIASDGGFYNQPIEKTSLEVPLAKRYEILLDVSTDTNNELFMNINNTKQLTIIVANELETKYQLPSTTNNLAPIKPSTTIDRTFTLEMLGGMMNGGMMNGGMMNRSTNSTSRTPLIYTINGKTFDMQRIDFRVKNGSVEYWEITNTSNISHPFHVHSTQFQIHSFNKQQPNDLMQGWHDTVFLNSGQTTTIAVPFDKSLEGIYMFHCHILEHEDAGMMGQFEISP